jgi:acyl carrier protein
MTNREKYDAIFCDVFELSLAELGEALEYQSIPAWDSVGHMSLMAELEDAFDISLDMDDVIEFGTYQTGMTTLKKYGIDI